MDEEQYELQRQEEQHQQNQAEDEYLNNEVYPREQIKDELGQLLFLARQEQTYITLEDLAGVIVNKLPDSKLLAEWINKLLTNKVLGNSEELITDDSKQHNKK